MFCNIFFWILLFRFDSWDIFFNKGKSFIFYICSFGYGFVELLEVVLYNYSGVRVSLTVVRIIYWGNEFYF